MSNNYKQKNKKNIDEINNVDNEGLSKKELYDLNQKKKREQREKMMKKNGKKKKKDSNKTYKTNLLGRVFAVIMLILMAGSVIATISYYFTGRN